MTGRRVWMVISDEHGNPEAGYELRNLTDIEFDAEEDYDEMRWDLLSTPTFCDRRYTFTLKCQEFTLYAPGSNGGWDEKSEAKSEIAETPRGLPPGRGRELE